MTTSELVTAAHLNRQALIYIRQSSPAQLLNNQESLKLQYALRQRAIELGWSPAKIETIDSDLGITASSAENRAGFKELIAQVTLGTVGIILSYDVTRLCRNCSDWYPLLDLCGYRGCLIADRDSVYDPDSTNGRLLLGLKGQISELELHTIKARLRAGALNKAKRGELEMRLPVGLVRDEQGVVHKHPDQEVQARISLVFSTFVKMRAASQVVKRFHQEELLIPRQDRFGDIIWRTSDTAAILSMLKNPAYAGAFVYGRTKTMRSDSNPHKLSSKRLPLSQWRVLVKDKYPAYISWEIYEQIQAQLQDNYADYNHKNNRGIPRPGAALIHGLVYCGECGHKMVVQYKNATRYICNYRHQKYRDKACQSILAPRIDDYVVKSFLEALSPVEIDAYAEVIKSKNKTTEDIEKAHRQQLERLRYQVALAERQYNQVDPDNRLVASELEQRWEEALRRLQKAEGVATEKSIEQQHPQLPSELKAAFTDIGKNLPTLWEGEALNRVQKKSLLRCLIDKVVIHRIAPDTVHIRIVWKGGEYTETDIILPVSSVSRLSNGEALEKRILALAKQGLTDQEIADTLTKEGFRSPTQFLLLPSTVQRIRLKHRLFQHRRPAPPRKIPGYVTVAQLADRLSCSPAWIYQRIQRKTILIEQEPEFKMYLFPDQPKTLTQFQALMAGTVETLNFSRGYQDAR